MKLRIESGLGAFLELTMLEKLGPDYGGRAE